MPRSSLLLSLKAVKCNRVASESILAAEILRAGLKQLSVFQVCEHTSQVLISPPFRWRRMMLESEEASLMVILRESSCWDFKFHKRKRENE